MNYPLISIDPSISGTGVAVLSPGCDLLEMHKITAPAISQKNKVQTKASSWQRINRIIEQLDEILDRVYKVHGSLPYIAIEITSGHTSRRHQGSGAGLATYGMVVGQVARWAIERVRSDRVIQVYENEWTRGSKKERRREHAKHLHSLYATHWYDRDKGGDISDAICLGEWAMNRINLGMVGGAA